MPTHRKTDTFRRQLLTESFPKEWETWLSANRTHYHLLRNAERDRNSRIGERRVYKAVAESPVKPPMRFVVQLDHADHPQAGRVAQHKINMLRANPVESGLPPAAARPLDRAHHVRQPHLRKEPVLAGQGLVKY